MANKRNRDDDEDDIVIISSSAKPSSTTLLETIQENISSTWSVSQLKKVKNSSNRYFLRCVIFDSQDERVEESEILWLRREYHKCFIIVYQPSAMNDPELRLHYFDIGVNMVAHNVDSILEILHSAVLIEGTGSYVCSYCDFYNLTEDELWRHTPAYHINSLGKHNTKCPICPDHTSRKPLQVHIHDDHGPVARARNGRPIEEQASIRCYSFSLVVCRHPLSGLYLLCQEFSGQGFWLPGGAVDAGESYATAARRETLEEAGVSVELKGILCIEHSPSKTGPSGGFYVRQRVIYYAEPKDNYDCIPKSIPDFESAGACWVSLEQMEGGLKMRGNEPLQWARHLRDGGSIYPLDILKEKVQWYPCKRTIDPTHLMSVKCVHMAPLNLRTGTIFELRCSL